MPQEYISLIRDSPCVPRTLQMQLKRINLLQNQAFLTYFQGKIKIIYLSERAKALFHIFYAVFDCGFIRRLLFKGSDCSLPLNNNLLFHIFITISRLFNFTVSQSIQSLK
jgi:hypothetical protein